MSPNSTILGHSLNGHLTLSKYFQYTPQVRGESKTGASAVGILLLRGDPARPDLLCVFTLSNEVTELDFPHSTIIVDSGLPGFYGIQVLGVGGELLQISPLIKASAGEV